jgi:hypothetical protein
MARECGGCTLCCKVLAIPELEKPKDVWCRHCVIGEGCKIYEQRPTPCREFNCAWLQSEGLPEHWYPARSKMVMAFEMDGRRIAVHVDPSRPDAWRQPPYHGDLRELTAGGSRQVIIYVGTRATVVLPDREIDLGACSEEERIVTYQRVGPQGAEWHAEKLHKDDPRFAA